MDSPRRPRLSNLNSLPDPPWGCQIELLAGIGQFEVRLSSGVASDVHDQHIGNCDGLSSSDANRPASGCGEPEARSPLVARPVPGAAQVELWPPVGRQMSPIRPDGNEVDESTTRHSPNDLCIVSDRDRIFREYESEEGYR
jgi:hypothetical protein